MRRVFSTSRDFDNPNNDVALHAATADLDNNSNDEHAIHTIMCQSQKSKERGFEVRGECRTGIAGIGRILADVQDAPLQCNDPLYP